MFLLLFNEIIDKRSSFQFPIANGDNEPVSKKQIFLEQQDYKLRNWIVFLGKIPNFISEILHTQNGYKTLTHFGAELSAIAESNCAKFAIELSAEIRNIQVAMSGTSQLGIIRVAETFKQVLLTPGGYSQVSKYLSKKFRI